MIFLFSLIKIPRLNLIRVRRKVSDFLSGLHRARAGKQFATSHLFLTQRENYIRVACSAIIILATNLQLYVHYDTSASANLAWFLHIAFHRHFLLCWLHWKALTLLFFLIALFILHISNLLKWFTMWFEDLYSKSHSFECYERGNVAQRAVTSHKT